MKRVFIYFNLFFLFSLIFLPNTTNLKEKSFASKNTQPMIAIVIDDFGSYDQNGVNEAIASKIPLTCAVMPFCDNSKENINALEKTDKEIILHMPMEAHVNLPTSWYGKIYITNYDSKEEIFKKLNKCKNEFKNIKGFNIHIGSGVSRNKESMKAIYEYAKINNLYFLDSKTIETNSVKNAAIETNSIYLERNVFLEPEKNKSYSGVKHELNKAVEIAKLNGYAIAIGHVGAEGGKTTIQAINDFAKEAKLQNIRLVKLSEIYQYKLNNNK